jgi:hypothetical protein
MTQRPLSLQVAIASDAKLKNSRPRPCAHRVLNMSDVRFVSEVKMARTKALEPGEQPVAAVKPSTRPRPCPGNGAVVDRPRTVTSWSKIPYHLPRLHACAPNPRTSRWGQSKRYRSALMTRLGSVQPTTPRFSYRRPDNVVCMLAGVCQWLLTSVCVCMQKMSAACGSQPQRPSTSPAN